MLAVYVNSTDVTDYLKRNSYRDSEQLSNRRNTANLTIMQYSILQGQFIYVYETLELRKQANSGQPIIDVKDTYEYEQKFRAGDVVFVDIKGAGERKYTILSIDHANKQVTFTENLAATLATTQRIGRLRFAGVVMSRPDREIGVTGTFEYDVQLSDWGSLYDRKNVVETYVEMYSREIIGRMIYEFCANDSEETIELFEAAWTEGGVAEAMSNDSADRIQGTNSQSTGTTGAGTATWTKTISAADISDFTHLRWWWKAAAGHGTKITAFKVRIGQDASNYHEYNIPNIGVDYDDHWSYESVVLQYPSVTVGSPDLSAVDWIQFALTSSSAIAAGNLNFDHMLVTTGGFTLQNVTRGIVKFKDLRNQDKKPSVVTNDVAKRQNMNWYIDFERDVHMFATQDDTAPFAITDTSQNYSNLEIEPDITKIVNRQTVRGGEAPDDNLYTQEIVADGTTTSWYMDYKPKTVSVYTDTGAGYVQKTVGVENLVDETTVDYVFNFNEKTLRKTSPTAVLAQGDKIKFTYYPYKDIRVRVQDPASIATMKALTGGDGIYDGALIIDESLKTFNDARMRAQAEVDTYKNPVITATFDTDIDGLHVGQLIHITDSSRGIDEEYLIQKITAKPRSDDRFTYAVTAGSTLFGIIEFFQYLLKKSEKEINDENERVDIVLNEDETIEIDDAYLFTQKSSTFLAGERSMKWWDFVAEQGSQTVNGTLKGSNGEFSNFYAEFGGGETGTIQFTTGDDNDTKELRITTAVGGTGKYAEARNIYRFPIKAATAYEFSAWLQILSAFTNQGTGAGVTITLKEYSAAIGGSVLATNTLTSAQVAAQLWNRKNIAFTSHASAAYAELHISIDAAIGTVSVSDILLMETAAETVPNAGIASFSQAS